MKLVFGLSCIVLASGVYGECVTNEDCNKVIETCGAYKSETSTEKVCRDQTQNICQSDAGCFGNYQECNSGSPWITWDFCQCKQGYKMYQEIRPDGKGGELKLYGCTEDVAPTDNTCEKEADCPESSKKCDAFKAADSTEKVCRTVSACSGHCSGMDQECQIYDGQHICICKPGFKMVQEGDKFNCRVDQVVDDGHCEKDADCAASNKHCNAFKTSTSTQKVCRAGSACSGFCPAPHQECQKYNDQHMCVCKPGYKMVEDNVDKIYGCVAEVKDEVKDDNIAKKNETKPAEPRYKMSTLCTNGTSVTAKIEYTHPNVTLLNFRAGSCNATHIGSKVIYHQDPKTHHVDVKVDMEGCNVGLGESLYVELGRKVPVLNLKLVLFTANIRVECGIVDEYEVEINYGTVSADFSGADGLAGGVHEYKFGIAAYSDEHYNKTIAKPSNRAGDIAYFSIGSKDLDASRFKHAVKGCQFHARSVKVNTTDNSTISELLYEYPLFNATASGGCTNDFLNFKISHDAKSGDWRFQHVVFTFDPKQEISYSLTCQIKLCDFTSSVDQCNKVEDSCGVKRIEPAKKSS